jgi:hypothetical protein
MNREKSERMTRGTFFIEPARSVHYNFTGPEEVLLQVSCIGPTSEVGRTSVSIPPNGHLARYASELFPGAPLAAFEGKIEIISSRPLVALTLRQRENVFTSLPVIP